MGLCCPIRRSLFSLVGQFSRLARRSEFESGSEGANVCGEEIKNDRRGPMNRGKIRKSANTQGTNGER